MTRAIFAYSIEPLSTSSQRAIEASMAGDQDFGQTIAGTIDSAAGALGDA
jgi:hypothetical protein